MGKFLVFSAASEAGWNWLVIVGVAATLVSLYYYLAVIRAMYMRPAAELGLAPIGGSPPREVLLTSAVVVSHGRERRRVLRRPAARRPDENRGGVATALGRLAPAV